MARIARVVAEGMPHHIPQRGNRRFGWGRQANYLKLLKNKRENTFI
jgi:hypothetical protein